MNIPRTKRNRRLILMLTLTLFLLLSCSCAHALTRTGHPGWTDLYDSAGGKIIAGLSYATPVTILEETGSWRRIAAGEEGVLLEGWVAGEDLYETDADADAFLITGNEIIPCENKTEIRILSEPRPDAVVLETWNSDSEDRLGVTGITADNSWLLAVLQRTGRPELWGYIPVDSVCLYTSAFVVADKANGTVNLRETPSKKGKAIGSYYSGALAEFLYDYQEQYGWQRISIGGVSGYMSVSFLETDGADGISYRSPLLALKGDSTPLYAAASGPETVADYPALSRADIFCILGKAEKRWHVRILTDEIGVWRYGFVETKDLEKKNPTCPKVDATMTKTTELLGCGEDPAPQCKKGKKVRISSFSVETPDHEDYYPLDYYQEGVRWVQITVYIRGDYGFDEPYFGYVPVDTVKFDKKLRLPAAMGVK